MENNAIHQDVEGHEMGEGGEERLRLKTRAKGRRRKLVAAAAVVVAVVALGAGMWVWHEQPSFCGTACHNVMGSYVEGYKSGDANLMVVDHAQQNYDCLDCHEPTIEEQVSELVTYVKGDYSIPLEDSGLGTREFCMRSGCHDDWEKIVEATSDWQGTKTVYNPEGVYNPHDNHRGDGNCGDCHKAHGRSTLYCVECHNMEVPEGWVGFE